MLHCPLWQQAQALSGVTPEQAATIDEVRALLRAGQRCLAHVFLCSAF
jgi:hypothetical protein